MCITTLESIGITSVVANIGACRISVAILAQAETSVVELALYKVTNVDDARLVPEV